MNKGQVILPRVCALVLLAVACGDSFSIHENYEVMTIDPSTLRVALSGSLGIDQPSSGRYYSRINDWRRRPLVSEFEIDSATGELRCGGHTHNDTAYVLQYRSRHHELMRGAFGRVVANVTYYYAERYSGQSTGFDVMPAPNDPCFERGRLVSSPDTAALALSAVSAAVIARDDTGYHIVAATWSPAGVMQSIATGRMPLAPDSLGSQYGVGVALTPVRQPPDSSSYHGLPTVVDVRAFVRGESPRREGEPAPVVSLVNAHYGRGVFVRQRADSGGIVLFDRWLHFPPRYADSMLAAIDTTRPFGMSNLIDRR